MNQYTRYLSLKFTIESLFGSQAWYDLKESNHLPTWRKHLSKVIGAIQTSILATVEFYDDEWLDQINDTVKFGQNSIKRATDIEEAISALAATFIKLSFLQVGLMPQRTSAASKITLSKNNWQLNAHRSVIYLQTKEQKESAFWNMQQTKIGHEKQKEIYRRYILSKSTLRYSEWCKELNP